MFLCWIEFLLFDILSLFGFVMYDNDWCFEEIVEFEMIYGKVDGMKEKKNEVGILFFCWGMSFFESFIFFGSGL